MTFEVAASGEIVGMRRDWRWWLLAALLVTSLGLWQRRRLVMLLTQYWKKLNPPEAVAARKLLQSCRRHDAAAAQIAWSQWHSMQDTAFLPGPDLRAAVIEMQRCIFGPATAGSWRGDELARAFDAERVLAKISDTARTTSVLPLLNP